MLTNNLLVKRTPKVIPATIAAIAKPTNSPCKRAFHGGDKQLFLQNKKFCYIIANQYICAVTSQYLLIFCLVFQLVTMR
jgi:hypothetical protein